MLQVGWNGEIAKNDQEDKQVVNRKRLLDQIACQELQGPLRFGAGSKCLLASRRMLRMATLASSADFLMRATIFCRCSPLMGGTVKRIILPSLLGDSPRSLERIAFSMSFNEF